MFNKIGFRTWKSGKLWLYMGVLGSTIILGSSPVSAMDSVGNQSQGNVLERRQRDAENRSQGNVLERRQRMQKTEAKVMFRRRQRDVENKSQGNVLERRQRDVENKSQGNVLERRQNNVLIKSQDNVLERRQRDADNKSQGNVLERRQRDVENKSQGNVLERRQHDVENKSQVGQLIGKNPLFSKSTVSRENNHSSQGDSNKQSFSKKVSQVTNVANRPMLTNNSRTISVINKLPKTGDDQNVIFKLVGFGLILLTSLCGLRRNEN
ncbi:LPXTG cell wall anchor domain-containing protein [Streptococcus agalactiae]|uniref:LPXTG cell wall anchor domain-containing protein n=1 Tax=Streptococcus agalactiae TaxID=1311 RepID=UPI0002FADCBD|nr:LPXTG cell wall anchor domain-containing protein [Streptococcus agalactiae]EPX22053.1 fibronectin-binding protein [Streptococcus agalactiae str. Gottschalk 13227]